MNIVERGLDNLLQRYQKKIINGGGMPNTSELVRSSLEEGGFGAALQAYWGVCTNRSLLQTQYWRQTFLGDRKISPSFEKLVQKGLTLLFATIVEPFETAAILSGKGEELQQLNKNLGVADWVSNPNPPVRMSNKEWGDRIKAAMIEAARQEGLDRPSGRMHEAAEKLYQEGKNPDEL